jgi:hypothetical protein
MLIGAGGIGVGPVDPTLCCVAGRAAHELSRGGDRRGLGDGRDMSTGRPNERTVNGTKRAAEAVGWVPPRNGTGMAPKSEGKVNDPNLHERLSSVWESDRSASVGAARWIRKITPAKMKAARRRKSLATAAQDTDDRNTPGEGSVTRNLSAKEEKTYVSPLATMKRLTRRGAGSWVTQIWAGGRPRAAAAAGPQTGERSLARTRDAKTSPGRRERTTRNAPRRDGPHATATS